MDTGNTAAHEIQLWTLAIQLPMDGDMGTGNAAAHEIGQKGPLVEGIMRVVGV